MNQRILCLLSGMVFDQEIGSVDNQCEREESGFWVVVLVYNKYHERVNDDMVLFLYYYY